MAPNQPPQVDPFWDFIRALDPNAAAASGVDHNASGPEFLRGFPFFQQPGGRHGPGRRGGRPPHGPHHPHHPHHPRGPPPPHGPHHGPPPPHAPHGPPHPPHGPPHGWNTSPFGWGMWTDGEWPQQDGQRGADNTQTAAAAAAPTTGTQNEKADLQEKDGSPDTMMDSAPDPAEVTPDESEAGTPPPYAGRGPCRSGPGACGGRGPRRGGRHAHREHNQGSFPLDLGALFSSLSTHPFVQNLQAQAQSHAGQSAEGPDAADTFSPPLDLFNTPSAYILHLALPGAKKSDIGVDWNPDAGELSVAGVVHRPGDEDFLSTLVDGERRVGVFERKIALPPRGADKDEVDGDAITAKMEDGVLIVTVPKVEKEWTEIRKVDIE